MDDMESTTRAESETICKDETQNGAGADLLKTIPSGLVFPPSAHAAMAQSRRQAPSILWIR